MPPETLLLNCRLDGEAYDLKHLRDYIAKDSPFYAKQFSLRIIEAAEKLIDHPQIGRTVPEAADSAEDIREIFVQDYRIFYLTENHRVEILAVIHGSRDLAGGAGKPWA